MIDVILANNALLETGGALENVGSVTATDVQFDEIANIVSLAHVDNIAIDSGAISSLTGGTPAYLTFDQAIAAFDAKVNTSITNFSIRDSYEELDADLASLNTAKSGAVIDNNFDTTDVLIILDTKKLLKKYSNLSKGLTT